LNYWRNESGRTEIELSKPPLIQLSATFSTKEKGKLLRSNLADLQINLDETRLQKTLTPFEIVESAKL
jgi:hypothetical protein